MIDKGIYGGDIVISVTQNTAKNGEIVVAMIDGNATVKNLHMQDYNLQTIPFTQFLPII